MKCLTIKLNKMSLNKWIGHGNVGKDPEVKTIGESKVAKFSMATNKTFKNSSGEKETKTEWHSIILWGKLAELAEKYVTKGSQLIVVGEITYRSYTNKDGATVYVTEIVGNEMHFTGSKEAKEPKSEAPQANGQYIKGGKVHVDSMSKAEDLPGYIAEQQEASAIDDSLPF